jgi:uncharacterized protein YbjT (DUF2867 family)
MENVLVAGANGTTGKKVVALLKASQYFNPVAMVRKENQREQFEGENISTVVGDLEKDISHTVQNMDKVIFASGSGGKKVVEVDQEGAIKLMDASKSAGIKKFVMLSSMGADEPEKAKDLQEYLQAKHQADEHLKHSGLNFAIIRPGSLTNDKGTGKIDLAKKLHKSGSISREDVARTLVKALQNDIVNNMAYEILEGDTPIDKAMESISG